MEAIPSGVCQAAEGGKESEDGRGGCVVGGGGVGGRRQGRRSVRESEEGNEGERGCRGTVGPAAGRTVVARQSERRGYGDESEGELGRECLGEARQSDGLICECKETPNFYQVFWWEPKSFGGNSEIIL